MKPCANEERGCENLIDEKYKYCPSCLKSWRETHPPSIEGVAGLKPVLKAWHDDPVVDALLKLNSNAGSQVKELRNVNGAVCDVSSSIDALVVRLESIALSLESIAHSLEMRRPTKKVVGMKRTKEAMDK